MLTVPTDRNERRTRRRWRRAVGLLLVAGASFGVIGHASAGRSQLVPADVASASPPGPPVARTSAGDHRMAVSWAAPADDGGAPVLTYRVQLASSTAGPWMTLKFVPAATHGVTFDRLTNGKTYFARVIAVNAAGPGTPSAPVGATPHGVFPPGAQTPGAPVGLRSSSGDGRITVAWDAPGNDGGSPVLTYRVQLSTSAGGPWTNWRFVTASTHGVVIAGLTNGTTYYARVIAVNNVGAGPPSAPVAATPRRVQPPGAQAPGAPSGLRSSSGNGRITVAWDAPADDGGSAVSAYRVQLSSRASGPWTNWRFVTAATHGVTIEGLPNGTTFYARVIAVNAVGPGTPSRPIAATPQP